MALSLKHISPQTKVVSIGLVLVVVPGLFISYLGYRSAQERADNLRTSTQTTLGLLRDKIQSNGVQLEQSIQGKILRRLQDTDRNTEPRRWIDSLESSLPEIADAAIVGNDGSVISSLLSSTPQVKRSPRGDRPGLFANKIELAEAFEFRSPDLVRARDLYTEASHDARTPAELALAVSRSARCCYKLGDYARGIHRYKQLLGEKFQTTFLSDVPVGVVALSEMADGYNALKDSLTARSTLNTLHRMLVDHPWDLRSGTYLYFLRLTGRVSGGESAMQKGDSLERREAAIVRQARILKALREFNEGKPGLDPVDGVSGSLPITHMFPPGSDRSVALCCFDLPGSKARTTWSAFAFLPSYDFVTRRFLPDILNSVDFGGSLVAGVVDSSGVALGLPDSVSVTKHIAIQDLSGLFKGWRVVLLDRDGRTIDELVAGEKRSYIALLLGTALIMLGGIIVTVRAAAHEMETARLKTEFVSNVSHELKTPLSLIRMFSETLDSDLTVNEKDHKDFVGIIRRESERLTHLVNNILDFSRIDAGRREYHFRSVDAVDIVRHALEAFRFRIQEQGFTVETCFPEHPLLMNIDTEAITQAVLNLIDNAMKYSAETREIRVEVRGEEGRGLIIVRDAGVGIAAKDIDHIFERFYRGSSQKTKQTRGTGIGLSLAKEVVEAHRGTMDVKSVPQNGSTFTITIPLSN